MEYKLATEDRFDEIKEHLSNFFTRDETLNKSLPRFKPGEQNLELENAAQKILEKKLSIIAANENDEIVGVALIDIIQRDYMDLDEKPVEEIPNKSAMKICRLLNELNRRANIFGKFDVDEIFDLHILSVDNRFQNKGICKEMITHAEMLARKRGFKLMKAEATGLYSQNVLKSKGFVASEEIYYDKWCDESGEPIFKVDPPHVKVQFLYKELK